MQIEYTHALTFDEEWPIGEVRGAIDGARRIVLIAHTNADGDAVGSVLGMYHLLLKATKAEVTPMLPDGVPDELAWLPGAAMILDGKSGQGVCRCAIATADLIITLDLNSLERTGRLAAAIANSKAQRMVVDHHILAGERLPLTVSEPEISSTCELVYWLMSQAYGNGIFNRDAATCLYTGICTDTGTFSYSNDRPSVYAAAAALLAFGIDPMDINRQIKNVFTLPRLRFFGHAMADLLSVYRHEQMALMVITAKDMKDFGVESPELTGLINEVMKLRDIDCGILVREEDDKVRLSLRSKVRYDVNRIAGDLFGGGGHKRAAGATSTMSLQDTVAYVKEKLKLKAEN